MITRHQDLDVYRKAFEAAMEMAFSGVSPGFALSPSGEAMLRRRCNNRNAAMPPFPDWRHSRKNVW